MSGFRIWFSREWLVCRMVYTMGDNKLTMISMGWLVIQWASRIPPHPGTGG